MYTNALATDDCSSFEVTEIVDTTFLNCASNYDIVRTFTVTDACGNMADAFQTIAVRDLTAPVISSTVDQPLLECDDEWSPPTLDAFDNCSDVVWNMTTETVGDPSTGAYVLNVLHIASDACGSTASIAQTVEFVDTTSPTFTSVPSDLVLSCEEEVPLNLAVAEDNCSSVTVEVWTIWNWKWGPANTCSHERSSPPMPRGTHRALFNSSPSSTTRLRNSPLSLPTIRSSAPMRCPWTTPRRPTTAVK